MKGSIVKVSGPLIVAENMAGVKMYDVVRVSKEGLIGEVIELRGDKASIQVYEETSMLGPGEEVTSTGEPLSVELAPGLIEGIFDGIQRPLNKIIEACGDRIHRGVNVESLDKERKWDFEATAKTGDSVEAGDVIGTVRENNAFTHRILIPNGVSGKIVKISSGSFNIMQTIAVVKSADGAEQNIRMLQKWPVRRGRPYKEKFAPKEPFVTGQRVIDTLFPLARGGVAAVPGPFGSGKTVVQHQLAKWADADVVVYVGCGERGNEMTDVLREFPHLHDPKTGESLMKRTILIANTSDMPVAAREASIYTGITIAEYFRDMGYNVAIMADSTSRWAEALREMSGRLEEMPGEEGYPAYLSSRVAEFYERAGSVRVNGSKDVTGSITAIGAVSPPGGDLSEPVAQSTLRIVKVFWGLSAQLAYRRHFPAIDWLASYSLYTDKLSDWYDKNVDEEWNDNRTTAQRLLQEEAKLDEIVRLVGIDALSGQDRLIMEIAKALREDYLHQNAFHEVDTYSSMRKQFLMLRLMLDYYDMALDAINKGVPLADVLNIPSREAIGRCKYIEEKELDAFAAITERVKSEINGLSVKEAF